MTTSPLRALVVGDRFVRASDYADALRRIAAEAGLTLEIETLELPYPSVGGVPLTTAAPDVPFRPLWEDPQAVVARAAADNAADPTLKEYTGPVDVLADRLAGVDALLVHAAPVSRNAIAAADRLKVVGVARGGPVNLNLEALNARRVAVFGSPARNARAVAEFLIGAILSLTRGIAVGSRSLQARVWRLDLYNYANVGDELDGRTIGLVGFGAVGRAFAPIARGFGLRLLVHDPYVADSVLHAAGAERADLDTLLSTSDYVAMAARLTPETRGLIGARELALLKPTAIFVNTARAELVDQAALRDAIARDAIAGAIVDVFAPEPPLADDPLLGRENVLLTPHIAGATREAAHRGIESVCRDVVAYLSTGGLDRAVNRQALQG